MKARPWLTSKEVALLISSTTLYAFFSFVPAFPIFGLQGGAITLAAMMAPVFGMLLGPCLGLATALLGGLVGLFLAPVFFPPSFVSGMAAAVFAGFLYLGRRDLCVSLYLSLLFLLGFYPFVGPIWIFPLFMWFQVVGLVILASPLSLKTSSWIERSNDYKKLLLAFFTMYLTATLAGQMAGSLTLEFLSWPILMEDIAGWTTIWQVVTWIYPVERILIALSATPIGIALYKTLKSSDLIVMTDHKERRGKMSDLKEAFKVHANGEKNS